MNFNFSFVNESEIFTENSEAADILKQMGVFTFQILNFTFDNFETVVNKFK